MGQMQLKWAHEKEVNLLKSKFENLGVWRDLEEVNLPDLFEIEPVERPQPQIFINESDEDDNDDDSDISMKGRRTHFMDGAALDVAAQIVANL